jgi:hypothetical protein
MGSGFALVEVAKGAAGHGIVSYSASIHLINQQVIYWMTV